MANTRTIATWMLVASLALFVPTSAFGEAGDRAQAQDDSAFAEQEKPSEPSPPSAENEAFPSEDCETIASEDREIAAQAAPCALDDLDEATSDEEDGLRELDGSDIPEGSYTIVSSLPGSPCLDVAGASLENGANVQVWRSNGTNAQRFWISYDAEAEAFRVQSMHSGAALDLSAGGSANGTNVQAWSLDRKTPNQLWKLFENENGELAFISCATGLALDVSGGSPADGTNVQGWEANGTQAQLFAIKDTPPLQDGVYRLQSSLGENLALDVRDSSRDPGAPLQLWDQTGVTAQKFLIESQADGTCSITALCSGLLLGCREGSMVQAPEPSSESEQDIGSFLWTPTPNDHGITFVNAESGLAMDVSGANAFPGADVDGWEPNGTKAQAFFPISTSLVSAGTYRIRCASDGRVLDVSGASFANGANVQLWADNATGAQRWNVSVLEDGAIVLENARSNQALDVKDCSSLPGANVQQWPFSSGNPAQVFYPIPSGDGWFYLKSACGDLYLDASGGGGYDGANVQMWTPNMSNAQKFAFEFSPWTFTTQDARESIQQASTSWGVTSFGGYAPSQSVLDALQRAIDRARGAGVETSVLMCDLRTGKGIAVNADARIYAASSAKGPYVASVVSTNPWSVGAWADTMWATIAVSSNEGYLSLYRAFGPAPLWEWSSRAGIDAANATSQHYPYYSARELALLWTVSYDLFTATEEGRSIAPWYESPLNSSIANNLGAYFQTWSKPGWIGEWGLSSTNDAGIVWGDGGPYVVALLTTAPANFTWHADILWALESAHDEIACGM